MKKILFVIIVVFYCYGLHSQCFDFYVKTPRNGNIKACSSGGYSSSQIQIADSYSRTFAIHVFEGGTNSYNCHGYAWHKKEGGNNVWINNVGFEYNNLNSYWNDGSYYPYDYNNQPHIDNLKVFYGNDDHTAITTSDSTIFISKMGCGCLVSHYKNNSPYTGGNFVYYQRAPTITGPTLFNTTATFTIQSPPASGTVSLQTSSGISASISGNTITVNSNYPGEGWLRMSVTTALGTVTSNTVYFIHGEYIPPIDIAGGVACSNNGCYADCGVETSKWTTNISYSTINWFLFGFSSDTYRSLATNFNYQARIVRQSTGAVVYTLPGTIYPSCFVPVDYTGLQDNTRYDLEIRMTIYNQNSSWHKVGEVLAITRSGIYSLSLGEFTLYPNPSNGIFTLGMAQQPASAQLLSQSARAQNNLSEQLILRIYTSLTGTLVKELPVNFSGESTINVSDLSQGYYIVHIIRNNEIVESKQIQIN